jgi:hypothetical protein
VAQGAQGWPDELAMLTFARRFPFAAKPLYERRDAKSFAFLKENHRGPAKTARFPMRSSLRARLADPSRRRTLSLWFDGQFQTNIGLTLNLGKSGC